MIAVTVLNRILLYIIQKKENKNKVVHPIIYVALLKKKERKKKTFSEVT